MEAQPRTCSSSSSSTAYPRWVMLEECLEIKVDSSSSSSCSPTDDDTNTLLEPRAAAAAMEAQPRTCSSASSSTAYPRWVMLEEYLETKIDSSSCSPTDDDTNTLAAARTSTGRPIQVSLRVAEPPALSRVRLRIPAGVRQEKSEVLAAHGDAVLIQVRLKDKDQQDYVTDHLVYKAGAAAAGDPPRPPSLSLLPPACFSSDSAGLVAPRELRHSCTGLLRRRGRGEDDDDEEVVVAELTAGSLAPGVAQLYMFRSGAWSRHDVEIREDRSNLPLVSWHTVVPVDYRLLCWVDLNRGVLLCDVLAETPRAQYVRLPMDPREGGTSNRNVCATATAGGGGGALKFVNVFPRCCCGGAGASRCERSRHAYTVHTWMLRRRIDDGDDGDMEWVMDGMVDATELWALDAYKGLPCAPIARPVVSTDELEVVCFSLREPIWPVWQIMVNMRSKTIHSVSCQKHGYCDPEDKLIPSNMSRFFNASYPCSGGGDDATTLTGSQQSQVDDIERTQDSVQALSLLEMSEALEEIPSYGLLGADEVKAYRILVSRDNGRRRLRSFLGLPKGLRKDWLLMEIKASDAN